MDSDIHAHMSYSDEWTHFTSIVKDGGNYYNLDPCFPLVDTSQPKTDDWQCDGYNPQQYPRIVENGAHDCRRLGHYRDTFFNYLVSRPLGAATTTGIAGLGEQAVVDRINELKRGFAAVDSDGETTYLNKIIWMTPIYRLSDQRYLAYMNNRFNWYEKRKARPGNSGYNH